MAFGVLEDPYLPLPPGTSIIGAKNGAADDASSTQDDTSHLKKDGDIILIPQPSDSPNDPLNWMAPMLVPALTRIADQYNLSLDTVSTWMVGLLVFWGGGFTFFTAAGSNILGKRPFIIISVLVLFLSNAWGAFATDFNSVAVVRTLQGMATAPFETMVTAVISDVFFLHQRGKWLALFGIVVSSGILISQVIAGAIIDGYGYQGTFGASASVFAVFLVLSFLLILETTYNKPRPSAEKGIPSDMNEITRPRPVSLSEKQPFDDSSDEMVTYASQLRIFRGRLSNASFWSEVFKPIPLLFFPAVIYSSLINGMINAFLVSVPPYGLNATQLGLINVPGFFTGLIAAPISGWMADAVATALARRNKGVFEPEFRLVLMIIGIPLITAGYAGFGLSVDRGHPLPVVIAWLALQNFASPFLVQASLAYVLDCHVEDANMAFVVIAFIKSILVFVATSFSAGILEQLGTLKMFLAISGLQFVVTMLTLPTYIFGKRLRSYAARSKLGQRLAREHERKKAGS
ncbi:MFS general substrate transporter [Thozetella sp. PMI_491]|nr:MFS general substrate transporter [Thozetella sp. PMI_491]